MLVLFFFFKQKTAYEMRISDWSSRRVLFRSLREQARARYGDLKQADDFTRIINEGQYRRLRGYLDAARERGLEVIELVALDPVRAEAERMIAPTVVLDPGDDARVMQDEIFVPILPIRGYRDLDDAIAYVEGSDRPLALYPFSHDRATVDRLLGRKTGRASWTDRECQQETCSGVTVTIK